MKKYAGIIVIMLVTCVLMTGQALASSDLITDETVPICEEAENIAANIDIPDEKSFPEKLISEEITVAEASVETAEHDAQERETAQEDSTDVKDEAMIGEREAEAEAGEPETVETETTIAETEAESTAEIEAATIDTETDEEITEAAEDTETAKEAAEETEVTVAEKAEEESVSQEEDAVLEIQEHIHSYQDGVCRSCGDIQDGFAYVDGKWGWYQNGQLQTDQNGIIRGTISGTNAWYYVQNGIYTKVNGIAQKADKSVRTWYYVSDGKFTRNSGVAKKADGSSNTWYYVQNGIFTRNSGIAQRADGKSNAWFYVSNGVLSKNTGISQKADGSSNAWYYVLNGVFTRNSGLSRKADRSNRTWYYVNNGRFSRNTGITQMADGSSPVWYYVNNGIFTKNTGIAQKADRSSSIWYYVSNGIFKRETGIAQKADGSSNTWFYVNNGRFTLFSGTLDVGVRTYTINNGRATDCNYYFFQDPILLPSGGYNLSTANIGLKVMYVNQTLLGSRSAYYTTYTANAVSRFQSSQGLEATGIVDLATWKALGYSEYDWYYLGTYTTPVKTSGTSTRQESINAMLQTASEYAYAGTGYNDGCSGRPGTYVDCSGLIFQCLYSTGINPSVNIVDHALAQYEYASNYLAADSSLGQYVSAGDLQAGDLVFYANNGSGTVNHVGIYAGGGMIYDSYPSLGVTYRSSNIPGQYIVKGTRVY